MNQFSAAIKLVRRSLRGRPELPELDHGVQLQPVDPRETDPEIREWLEPHMVALDPRVAQNGHLLIFLAGSFGHPGRQKSVLTHAATMGFAALNITYPNSWTVGALCRKTDDPDCHQKLRLQITEGGPTTGLISMSAADSIINRITKLLVWLGRNRPNESWGSFIQNGEPNWEKVVIAGHSQGGGHAAFIGKRYRVARVVMLGSPADRCFVAAGPAPWLAMPGRTPAECHYGFAHARDHGIDRILPAWQLLGLPRFGPVIDVDREAPPYRGSHQLVSDRSVPEDKFHASVATDATTPRAADGTPHFAPVWDYLFRLV
jgi:hypothetical protein